MKPPYAAGALTRAATALLGGILSALLLTGCLFNSTGFEPREGPVLWRNTPNTRDYMQLQSITDGVLTVAISREQEREQVQETETYRVMLREKLTIGSAGEYIFMDSIFLGKIWVPAIISIATVPVAIIATPFELLAAPFGHRPKVYRMAYTFWPIDLIGRLFGEGLRRYDSDFLSLYSNGPRAYRWHYGYNLMDGGLAAIVPFWPYASARRKELSRQEVKVPELSTYTPTGPRRYFYDNALGAGAVRERYVLFVDGQEMEWLDSPEAGRVCIDLRPVLAQKGPEDFIEFELREVETWDLALRRSYGVVTFTGEPMSASRFGTP